MTAKLVIPAARVAVLATELKAALNELELQKTLMRTILRNAGAAAHCKLCGQSIFWIQHQAERKSLPYNQTGVVHFSTCPKRPRIKGEPYAT